MVISGELMVTHNTTQRGLRAAVAAFCMPTRAASLAGVGRIDTRYRNTRALRLVTNKRPQLAEGPIAVSCALPRPVNPRPRADTLEVFTDNRSLRAFGFRNEPLADSVVRVSLKAILTACQSFQVAFGRFCRDFLERLSARLIPLAAVFNLLARKGFAIRVACEIDDAQIHAKRAFGINRFGYFNLTRNEQIPLATDEGQISFAALCGKQFALAFAAHERNGLSSMPCPDRHRRTRHVVGKHAVVVGYCAMGVEGAQRVAIQLVGVCDVADTAYRKLRGQTKRFTHSVVGQLVDSELPKRRACVRYLADVIAGGIRCFTRAFARIGLIMRGQQLHGGGQSHRMRRVQSERPCNYSLRRAEAERFLPPVNGAGFRA